MACVCGSSTAQALTALRKMMAMETEERKAKADKEAAALTVERSMVKARQLSDYLKIAAARQQLSSTKSTFAAALAAHEDSLKDRDAQSSEEVSKHIQIKESMAAMRSSMAFDPSIRTCVSLRRSRYSAMMSRVDVICEKTRMW